MNVIFDFVHKCEYENNFVMQTDPFVQKIRHPLKRDTVLKSKDCEILTQKFGRYKFVIVSDMLTQKCMK